MLSLRFIRTLVLATVVSGTASATTLDTSLKPDGNPIELLSCRRFGAGARCQGNGPWTLGTIDLKSTAPELLGEDIDVSVRLTGTLRGVERGVVVHVGNATLRLGDSDAPSASGSVLATDSLVVTLATDYDGRPPYVLPTTPTASVSRAAVSITPQFRTLERWSAAARDAQETIETRLDHYDLVQDYVIRVRENASNWTSIRNQVERKLRVALTGTNLAFDSLFYPTDHPDASLRGRMKSAQDMPAEWAPAIMKKPEIATLAGILANIRVSQQGGPAVSEAELTQLAQATRKSLESAAKDGQALVDRLSYWELSLNNEMKATRDVLRTIAEQARATAGTP